MLAIDHKVEVATLKQMIQKYVEFQDEVVAAARYDLKKAKGARILEV